MRPASAQAECPRGLTGARSYILCAMYWPLFGGFIAFVVLALIMGWIMDPKRRGDADGNGHH